MCDQFMASIPEGWVCYPETGNFDMVLVRESDGAQVGIEAKLKLSAKVIAQSAESWSVWRILHPAPDFRAVLVPSYVSHDMRKVCSLIGVQVVRIYHKEDLHCQRWGQKESSARFYPDLPSLDYNHREMCGEEWFDFCPSARLPLPDYIPDTGAGSACPVRLSGWKVKAIKIVVILEKRGYVTRADFKHHAISMSRWTQGGMLAWLQPGKEKGQWVVTSRIPDFRAQHPINFSQIEEGYEDWKLK